MTKELQEAIEIIRVLIRQNSKLKELENAVRHQKETEPHTLCASILIALNALDKIDQTESEPK